MLISKQYEFVGNNGSYLGFSTNLTKAVNMVLYRASILFKNYINKYIKEDMLFVTSI